MEGAIISNDTVKLIVFAGTRKLDFLIESARGWVVSVFNFSCAAVIELYDSRWWQIVRNAKLSPV